MIADPFDRDALRAYIAAHNLKETVMAAHAGIAYRTLRRFLHYGGEPSPPTRYRIEQALRSPPPIRPLPKNGQAVANLWPHKSIREIARSTGIHRFQVYRIAKGMGLPSKRRVKKP